MAEGSGAPSLRGAVVALPNENAAWTAHAFHYYMEDASAACIYLGMNSKGADQDMKHKPMEIIELLKQDMTIKETKR